MSSKFDPIRIGTELREQFSSSVRKLGFFLGAGCSISAGIPDLLRLTKDVEPKLGTDLQPVYQRLAKAAGNDGLEWILNRVRLIPEVLGAGSKGEVDGISGEVAKSLDQEICKAVLEIMSSGGKNISDYKALASWVRQIDREHPVEVFTTNYDLLIEEAFEAVEAPFFDGFVGVVEPFFVAEAIESRNGREASRNSLPKAWTRLWKLHGSVGWQIATSSAGLPRIVRHSIGNLDPGNELLIYPSRDKYMATRKMPFLVYLDRLREFLSHDEVLMIVSGYSFRDEHINYIISQGLRANSRAAVHAFLFGAITPAVLALAATYRNLTVFAPESVVMGGTHETWQKPTHAKLPEEDWCFWDEPSAKFTLGDFGKLTSFLSQLGGPATTGATGGTKP